MSRKPKERVRPIPEAPTGPWRRSVTVSPAQMAPASLEQVCREMYLRFVDVKDISRSTGIAQGNIRQWMNKHKWKELRDARANEMVGEYLAGKGLKLSEVATLSLDLIIGAMRTRKERMESEADPEPLTLQEAKLVSDIFGNVDKIMKLDRGDATEIVQVEPVSMDEIKEALVLDKFIELDGKALGESWGVPEGASDE